MMNGPEWLFRILRERARRRGHSLAQELRAILGPAENATGAEPLPPVRLATARTSGSSTWSREETYGEEGR
jgi:plasmid stability protein